MKCECKLLIEEDLLFVCPMHYAIILKDCTVDYGLVINKEINKELSEKYGVPIVTD